MTMSKYDRMLHILNLLRSRRNLNAATLAKECGCTERSIYRDIISLSEANVPIYYDNGYKLATDNFLPPLNFNFEEYSALRLALESTPLNLTGKYGEILRQIRAKVESNLPAVVREQKKTAVSATAISIESTQSDRAELWFGEIEAAARESYCLEMSYNSVESGPTSRVVEPYFVVFRGRAFYLVAYCRLRQDFRTFRLDQIQSLSKFDEHFQPRQGVTAERYFDGSWQVYSGDPIEVLVRFTGKAAKIVSSRTHHQHEEVSPQEDGSVLYRITVRGVEEIQRWVLGFGSEAEILEPDQLRWEMSRLAQALDQLYRKSDQVSP
ncbi:MAG: YafY family transcriptional regulator [bacterium]|nr:YafY family transcriptional regulator [bacterium]